MSNEAFKKEYEVLVDELTHILNSKEIVPELQNESVVMQLLKSIKICEFLEDKLDVPPSNRKSFIFLKILSQYYAISNIHVDSYYYIDETILNDDVTYLKVFSKNLLKKDYKELTPRNSSGNNMNQSPNVHKAKFEKGVTSKNNDDSFSGVDSNSDDSSYNYFKSESPQSPYGNGAGGLFSNLFGAGYGGFNGGFMSANPEDQMAAQAASNRMTEEIASGKLYVFNGKPKYIPILKVLIAVFLIVLVAVIIINAALAQVADSVIIPNGSELYTKFSTIIKIYYDYGDLASTSNVSLGSVTGFSTGWFWFFVVMFSALFIWQAYLFLRTPRNDNEKYKVQVGWLIFDIIITFFYFLYVFEASSVIEYMFNMWPSFVSSYSDTSYLGLMTSTYAFSILYLALLGFLLVVCIFIYLIKPKQNFEFLNNKFQQYYEEARQQISDNYPR